MLKCKYQMLNKAYSSITLHYIYI